MHWADEWCVCSECGVGVKLTPDCYGWQPNYITTKGDRLCRKCAIEDVEDVLEEEFANNPNKALPSWLKEKAVKKGWISLVQDNFETGWHSGQTDDPQAVLNEYIEEYPEDTFVFCIDTVGAFDVHFSIYKLNKEII